MDYDLIQGSELNAVETPSNTDVLPVQNGTELKKITFQNLKNAATGDVSAAISSEASARATAVSNEATARANADTLLETAITNEATARGNADTALQNAITAEATARESADSDLRNAINTVKSDVDTLDFEINGQQVTIEYVANQYVDADGKFKPYNNWSRTNFIPVPNDGYGYISYSNIATPSAYCAFYSDKTDESFVRRFSIQNTQTGEVRIPEDAKYFVVSNYTTAIMTKNTMSI